MTSSDYIGIWGIVIGVISPLAYMTFFRLIKPKLLISEKIAATEDKDESKPLYVMKVLNLTRFDITNVRAELFLMKSKVDGYEFKEIRLRKNEFMRISQYKVKDEDFSYVIKLSTYEDLKSILKSGMFLRLKISATHSLSSTTQDFSKDFTIRAIYSGVFKARTSLEIVSE